MIRKTIMLAGLAAGACAIALNAHAQDRVVNVFNWSDYIDDELLQEFTEQTGIRVVYDVFDSNEILETRLLAGSSGYDVVVPTASFLQRQIQAGVFQPLQKDLLPNLDNMWGLIEEATEEYDPGNEYSINYMWGTVGIGYNPEMVEEALGTSEITSWGAVFDPETIEQLASCGVYFLDSPTDVIPVMQLYLGLDPLSTESEDLAAAEEALLEVRPHIRRFHSSEYINALANGDICVAIGWSGDVFQAADRAEEAGAGVEVAYAVPEEGTQMWFDQMAIPGDAPNVEEAHEFLNFIMEPEVIARSTNYVYFANGNEASMEYVDDEIINDPAIYPSPETMERMFTVMPYEPRFQREVTRSWTRVTTGQ